MPGNPSGCKMEAIELPTHSGVAREPKFVLTTIRRCQRRCAYRQRVKQNLKDIVIDPSQSAGITRRHTWMDCHGLPIEFKVSQNAKAGDTAVDQPPSVALAMPMRTVK